MPIVTGTWERIQPGMDTSMDTIVVGVLRPGGEVSAVHVILNDGESLRRLIGKFPGCPSLAACYEAGPGGYELHRLLASMGVTCDVVRPPPIPAGAGARARTDGRDAANLALLHWAGLLTAIRVPRSAEEAVRDLARTRGADGPRCGTGCPGIRPAGAGEPVAACRHGDTSGLLAGHRRAGPAARWLPRSSTSAGLPPRGSSWVHAADAVGVLQRPPDPPRRHHQGRPAARAEPAGRGRVSTPVPPDPRRH